MKKNKNSIVTLFAPILTVLYSWIITIFFVYFICLCFNLSFTFRIATGIWLSLILLNVSLQITTKGDK